MGELKRSQTGKRLKNRRNADGGDSERKLLSSLMALSSDSSIISFLGKNVWMLKASSNIYSIGDVPLSFLCAHYKHAHAQAHLKQNQPSITDREKKIIPLTFLIHCNSECDFVWQVLPKMLLLLFLHTQIQTYKRGSEQHACRATVRWDFKSIHHCAINDY